MNLKLNRLVAVSFVGSVCFLVLCLFTTALAQTNQPGAPSLVASAAFQEWLADVRRSDSQSFGDPQALSRGLELAQARRQEMLALMEADPERFLREAMPESDQASLPAALQPFIEQRVRGRGSFAVYCGGLPGENHSGPHPHGDYGYEVVINGARYQGFVFGEWRNQTTVREAMIDGVALGDAVVLGDSPTPDQQAAAGEPVTSDAPTANGANTLLYMIARFSDETTDPITDATALSRMDVVSTFWQNNSSGTVSLRGLANPGQVMDVVHITLPQPKSYGATYNGNFSQLLSDARSRASAAGYNYNNYNLDVLVTSDQSFSYAGRAYIGSQGAHLVVPYTTLRTAGHELGHNLGLYHADYWRTDATEPFSQDSVPGGYVADTSNAEWIEYGHYFSIMAAQFGGEWDDATKPHHAAAEKVRLGWLSGNEVQYVSTSGSYRLYRHDARTTIGTPRAIRIETPASDYTGKGRRYWLNYRFAPWSTGQNWLQNGVQVDVCQTSYGGDGAIQLDMTPYSNDDASGASYTDDNTDKRDGAIVVGRTYSDPNAGIHITPTAVGNNGANEEYIDVRINLGAFAGNRAPVIGAFSVSTSQAATGQAVNFSVNATDADGDPLAYAWDFDQGQSWTQSGLNSPAASKSWSSAGQYRVVVTVSDMKGGVATESAIITVGSPANNREIWGRVLWAGFPVYNARVWTTVSGSTRQAWTDSDGAYVLTDLASADLPTVKCARSGLTFSAQFANPVSVSGGNAYGKDFYANESLPGGGGATTYVISGRVTYGGVGVSGAEVRAGGCIVTSDASGNYQFTNVPPGNYTVVPWKDNWTFSPANRAVTVSAGNSSGNNFSRVAPYSISGQINGPSTTGNSPAPTVYLSNGQSVPAAKLGSGPNKYWGYTLDNVPAGQFSVSASLSGYQIVPANFSNPLSVSGNLTGRNFDGSSAAASFGYIAGRITERGLPLPGATVAARVGGTTVASMQTDSDGYYRIENLTSGAYTLIPSRSGYAFSPSSINVSGVPSAGRDFTATGPNTPPGITSFTATPSTVASVAGTTVLTAAATGSSPLIYQFDALVAPGPVTFSVNDSSAASTTAGFQAAGSHVFRVKVTDANGFSTVASANVTVSAGAGTLVVAPYEVELAAGQSLAFDADAWDELGNLISVSPTWSVDGGGSIDSSGMFTALIPGGPYQVTAVASSLSATGFVWVTGTPPLRITSITATNGSVILTWSSIPGSVYRVQYVDSLANSTWNALLPDITATGSLSSKVDPATAGARYYRVMKLN